MQKMTKSEALSKTKCSIRCLAKKLGISHSAIVQWNENEIPLARQYQILDILDGKSPLINKKAPSVGRT